MTKKPEGYKNNDIDTYGETNINEIVGFNLFTPQKLDFRAEIIIFLS